MSGALQAVFQNLRSFKLPPPGAIGSAYGGGYYAGQISTTADGVATHYLVVSDATVGDSGGLAWGPIATTTGVTSVIDGPTNSATLAALGSSYAAATFCETLNAGGYTDWYLPALDETSVLYYFLKPGTSTNVTSPASGSTAYAVSPQPISTNYSSGTPAQTAATNFRGGAGDQEFSQGSDYNTSTEFNDNYKWIRSFDRGQQKNSPLYLKTRTDERTRAIRRVPV
jgi:hypothetical protein